MGSLKDALLKAGLKGSSSAKDQNKRKFVPKSEVTKSMTHQKQRNYCEECDTTQPDVELYKHSMPTTNAEWMCVRCADKLKIADKFRKTAQSDTSIRNMFKREYGATTPKKDIKPYIKKSHRPVNGNR